MSRGTLIQWADDTVNPVMGCNAPCELRPGPGDVRELIRTFFREQFDPIAIAEIDRVLESVTAGRNATEIYQLRDVIVQRMIGALNRETVSAGARTELGKRLKGRLDSI